MTDAQLNGIDLSSACPEAVITSIERQLGGAVRDEFVEVPGRAGAWVFDEEPGETTITLGIDVLVDTIAERRAAIGTLRGWARTPTRAALILSDESDRFWTVKLAAAPQMTDDEYVGQTSIAFSAEPYAWALTTSLQEEAASGSPDSGSFAVTDDLNANPEVRITPTNGTITSCTLTVNGETVAWQVDDPANPNTVASAGTLTVSSISDTVLFGTSGDTNLVGVYDPTDVDMANVDISAFPLLTPGTNTWALSWTGTATTVDVDFTWRERYV